MAVGAVRCLPVLLLVLLAVPPAAPDVTTFDTSADQVDLSWDGKSVTLSGNAELYGRSHEDPGKWVRVRAELIEGDLETGRFEALGGVLMTTEQGAMRGDSLFLDGPSSRYELRRGGFAFGVNTPQDTIYGFAYGREVVADGHVVRINGSALTTCERPRPHYALEARQMVLNTEKERIYVKDAAVRLYGVRIPLLPYFWFNLPSDDDKKLGAIPSVRVGGRDGLVLWWGLPYKSPEHEIEAKGGVALTLHRGIRAQMDVQGPVGGMQWHVRATHKEDVPGDLYRWSLIDRRPELALEDTWGVGALGDAELQMEIAAGSYKEHAVDARPAVYDQRAMASLRLVGNDDQWQSKTGHWWWLGAREQIYGSGTDYQVLEAAIGGGTELTDWLKASLTCRVQEGIGATPFEFDDVDTRRELAATARFQLSDSWSLRTLGRYDFDFGRVSDYEVELARRLHCITWSISYHDLTQSIWTGVELNGLFGDEPVYQDYDPTQGPPDYWAVHGTTQDDAATE